MGNGIPFSFYYFTDHFFDLDSKKRVKGKLKSGEVAEPDKQAHRQLGVCGDSNVLSEYRIKELEKFHSAMNEDFQSQFKNAYDQDHDYIHGEAHKQLELCFGHSKQFFSHVWAESLFPEYLPVPLRAKSVLLWSLHGGRGIQTRYLSIRSATLYH